MAKQLRLDMKEAKSDNGANLGFEEKMAKLVKLVGMLLQTKVYLFWQPQNQATSQV